jgi:hypothetical protein
VTPFNYRTTADYAANIRQCAAELHRIISHLKTSGQCADPKPKDWAEIAVRNVFGTCPESMAKDTLSRYRKLFVNAKETP